MGGKVLCAYPFISAVGAEISPYTYHNYAAAGIAVSAAEEARLIGDEWDKAPSEADLHVLHERGLTGKGVGIAVIDTGVYPHLEFCVPRMRIAAFVDFVADGKAPYDDHGHGTAVASVACGGGAFGAVGAAPLSHLVALKAVDHSGTGNVLHILTAMQWLYTHARALGVRVVNLSIGSEPMGAKDPLVLGVQALSAAGLTVVTSAGNAGPENGTLKSPGIAPAAITVGGAERGAFGWQAASFSSRGNKRQNKPDLIAPAVAVETCAAGGGYVRMSGTSMAAPLIAGVCALWLGWRPTLTPAAVKAKIISAVQKLDCPVYACGAGVLDPFR